MTDYLQTVNSGEEADRTLGKDYEPNGIATLTFQSFECDLTPADYIFRLLCRPVSGRLFYREPSERHETGQHVVDSLCARGQQLRERASGAAVSCVRAGRRALGRVHGEPAGHPGEGACR